MAEIIHKMGNGIFIIYIHVIIYDIHVYFLKLNFKSLMRKPIRKYPCVLESEASRITRNRDRPAIKFEQRQVSGEASG